MSCKKWLIKNCHELKDKIVVITGTTSGIGFESLKHLCHLNAKIIAGVRNTNLAETQKESLLKIYPNANIVIYHLDLADVSSIKLFAENILKNHPNGIDALINNAGIFSRPRQILKYGYEQHFFINTIAPIILTNLLLPALEKNKNSNIVFVSSISLNSCKFNSDNIDMRNTKSNIKLYANSKCWLSAYALKLKENLQNINVNIASPGITNSALLSNKNGKCSKLFYWIASTFMKMFFHKTTTAALSEIYAATAHTKLNHWITPRVFGVWGAPKSTKIHLKHLSEQDIENCYKTLQNIANLTIKM